MGSKGKLDHNKLRARAAAARDELIRRLGEEALEGLPADHDDQLDRARWQTSGVKRGLALRKVGLKNRKAIPAALREHVQTLHADPKLSWTAACLCAARAFGYRTARPAQEVTDDLYWPDPGGRGRR
jgi:hypothetical protein